MVLFGLALKYGPHKGKIKLVGKVLMWITDTKIFMNPINNNR